MREMKLLGMSILVLCVFSVGCQSTANVRLGDLDEPSRPVNMEITMLSKALDVRKNPSDRIGKHTISIFMIPGGNVNAKGKHLDEAIGEHCRTALEKAGYTVNLADYVDDVEGPVLTVQVDLLRNYTFTWFYPFGLLFGKMKLSVSLVDAKSGVLWSSDVKSAGGFMPSMFYICGFGTAVKSEVTGSINNLVDVCTSDEFVSVLKGQ